MGINDFRYYYYYYYSLLLITTHYYQTITPALHHLLINHFQYYPFTILFSHHSHVYSLNPSITGCDSPTPPESEDDANMLQPSEQDPVATDN
jgi:hypothetical protein